MHVLDEAGRRGSRGSKQRFIPPRPWPHARAAARPASPRPRPCAVITRASGRPRRALEPARVPSVPQSSLPWLAI